HRCERQRIVVAVEKAGDRDDREGHARPRDDEQLAIRITDEVKEGGGGPERDRANELGRRQEAALAEKRPELVDGHQERDEIDDAERALEDETREPVIRRGEPVHGAATLRAPWTRHGAPSAPWPRPTSSSSSRPGVSVELHTPCGFVSRTTKASSGYAQGSARPLPKQPGSGAGRNPTVPATGSKT